MLSYQSHTEFDALEFPIAETFISINGEGQRAGMLAAFIRFPQCNLNCSYCDTLWAAHPEHSQEFISQSIGSLINWIAKSRVQCVTITGGEPLLQPHLPKLLQALNAYGTSCGNPLWVEIETNGSQDLAPYNELRQSLQALTLSFTMDWKSPSSGMEQEMLSSNLALLTPMDTLKFVVGSEEDLQAMKALCDSESLWQKTSVYISPIADELDPTAIVVFMQTHFITEAHLQLQLHKIIWPQIEKGV